MMSIDATKPADSDLGSTIGTYLREAREQINTILSAIGSTPALDIPKVLVDADDAEAGYLEDKLIAGSNVTLTEAADGQGVKTITIASTAASDNNKFGISSADTTPDFWDNKIIAGSNITLTKANAGGDETITITATGGIPGDDNVDYTETAVNGNTSWVVGGAVGDIDLEYVRVNPTANSTIQSMTAGTDGQVKRIIADPLAGNTLTLEHSGTKATGTFYLNGDGEDYAFAEGDWVEVINIGGDGGSNPGYWRELCRYLAGN